MLCQEANLVLHVYNGRSPICANLKCPTLETISREDRAKLDKLLMTRKKELTRSEVMLQRVIYQPEVSFTLPSHTNPYSPSNNLQFPS